LAGLLTIREVSFSVKRIRYLILTAVIDERSKLCGIFKRGSLAVHSDDKGKVVPGLN
jgi:hypothetical protein